MSIISDRNTTAESDGDRDGMTIGDHVPAGATGREASITLDAPATIEHLSVRIYQGAQLDLELRPVVRHKDNTEQPLLEYAGKTYVDGDDDRWDWPLSKSIEEEEEIVIYATNRDGSNAYDYRVNVAIDYHGGSSRNLVSLLSGGVL